MQTLTIEEHDRADDDQIFDLQQRVYPDHPLYKDRSLTKKYWQWRYYSNPEVQSLVYVAVLKDAGTIVGVRPMSIVPAKVGNRRLKALWLNAVITHPGFRNQGIFSSLVQHSMAQAEKLGADFAYSFPNQNSYPIYQKKAEWRTIGNIPVLAKIVSYPRLGRKMLWHQLGRAGDAERAVNNIGYNHSMKKTYPHSAVELRLATQIDDSYTELWEDVSRGMQVALPRGADYLNWRYLQNPVLQYEIVEARGKQGRLDGYIVIGVQQRQPITLGLIVDLLFRGNNGNAARMAFQECLCRLKAQSADMVCALQPAEGFYRDLLNAQGFFRIPKRQRKSRVNFIGSIINSNIEPNSLLFDYNNWFLTWGDTDNA